MYRILAIRNLSRNKNNLLIGKGTINRCQYKKNQVQNYSFLCNRVDGFKTCFRLLPETVTDTSTKETKTTVQKLKAQKLANFISHQISHSTISSMNPEDIVPDEEGVAVSCSDKIMSGIPTNLPSNWNLEETPVIYIGKDMKEIELSQETLAEILESYRVLKELHEKRKTSCAAVVNDNLEEEFVEPMEKDITNETVLKIKKGKKAKEEPTKSKESSKKFVSKYYKSSELELLARQKSFHVTLSAYLDMCLTRGMVNRAYATVLSYRHKRNRSFFDVSVYNMLLHGYAAKGNLPKVKDILKILKEDKIDRNSQTYAAIFECLGRLETTNELKAEARSFLQEAKIQKLTMNDIMNNSKFIEDQREILLGLFRELDPGFIPRYTVPVIHYDNHLLNDLNEHVLPIESKSFEIDIGIPQPGSELMTSKFGFSRDELEQMTNEQLELELKGHLKVKSIQNIPEPSDNVQLYRRELEELRKTWTKQASVAFNRDVNTLKAVTESKAGRSINLFPYLKALDVAQYTEILLDEAQMLIEGSDTFSYVISHLHRELGKKVEARYHVEQKRSNGVLDKTCEIYGMYCDALSEGTSSDNPRQLCQRLVHENRQSGASMDIQSISWPKAAVNGVGRFLYSILKNDLKVNVNAASKINRQVKNVPAFYSLFRYEAKIAKEQIKPHPVLVKLFRKSQQDTLKFDVNLVPMLCPPQPWSTPENGGYILAKSELIRLPQQAHQQIERIANVKKQDMYPTLDSLNQLGSIPWRINEGMLNVVLKVFNDGGNAKLDVPEPPSSLPQIEELKPRNEMSNYDKFDMLRKKISHKRKQGDMYSLWCDALYRLSLANHFRKRVFWLPQNIDFRGRVYPIPPHLNHLGHDLARCLMVFHQKKPLGPDGFDWLKLHCINLTGLKKRDSVADRLKYANEIMDDILDSADRPLSGKMWWSKSDEPWQTLACCMEIAKVHRCPDPTKFLSGFPIHQDGSCNGLQHYAALGRDKLGAISVNLAPAEKPQDVYSAVAALVEDSRAKDAENNIKVAKILEGFIQRKVIKQTVMTTVYGVTRYGARKQIARQLEYIDEFPKDWVWPASSYLTSKTFNALGEMFTSAKEIQDWFTDCARLISAVCAQNVEWTTPLGLPVVQPYNRSDRPYLSAKSIQLPEHFSIDSFEKPNIMKQKNAFPPNFVHSLDSSHMMLTSLHCERAGLTFVSVHDCYWTHACTVPLMNKICREQFVALHSEPILEDLSKFLVQKYSYDENEIANDGSVIDLTKRKLNRILHQYPDKGTFDLREVLNSIYFFS
ncbi:DNA-directed RNA polymerase, mitochondrial isoform X2 [Uranotaenia lowii]|uniref:DNA-directed RNA polymerase, mitochondrial isoform X2 n=1 Tax=Uranotaenia lowii TaxID=190385 RepID=UPI00247AFC20|nr:DNA-directed RNA polymerase, mitochondrial isoform X2 [Uranotaenia lowii]